MNKQILKTSDADVLSSRKKLRKTLGGLASPRLYIWGLIELCSESCIKQNWIRGSPSIKQPRAKVLENWPVLSRQLYQVVVITFCPNSQVIFYCLHP